MPVRNLPTNRFPVVLNFAQDESGLDRGGGRPRVEDKSGDARCVFTACINGNAC